MKEINLKSSTIEKSVDLAKGFLQSLVKPSVDELGLLIADKVKVWRLKNQINTLGKVQKIIKEKNVKPQQVNLKVLLPYLDAVSLEEDEKLQDIWANLLVNYIDSSKNLTSVVYPHVLRQLSSKEIDVLDFLIEKTPNIIFNFHDDSEYKRGDFANLIRLGIIENPKRIGRNSLFGPSITPTAVFRITLFGKEFITACKLN